MFGSKYCYKIRWETHVTKTLGKLTGVLYLLRCQMEIADQRCGNNSVSYFMSLASYGIELWGRSSHTVTIIFKIENRGSCKNYVINNKMLTFTVYAHL